MTVFSLSIECFWGTSVNVFFVYNGNYVVHNEVLYTGALGAFSLIGIRRIICFPLCVVIITIMRRGNSYISTLLIVLDFILKMKSLALWLVWFHFSYGHGKGD